MSPYRLHQQFIRLWQCCHGQPQQVTLDSLAQLSGCSRRHMRSLLAAMQQQGWLSWQAAAGRGRRSWLTFHYNGISSQPQQIAGLLAQDKIDQLRQQLDASQLAQLLQANTGYSQVQNQWVYRLLTRQPLANLLPGSGLRTAERHVVHQVFSGLLRLDSQTATPQASLAYRWSALSPVHWRFWLRPGVRFHHGRPLDCADVVSSLQRLSTQPLGAHIHSVTARDQHTVDLRLQQPDRWLLWLLCHDSALILPKEWASLTDFERHPLGCGAYRVMHNAPSALTLQAFDDYFGYRALTDRVSIWRLADGATYPQPSVPSPPACVTPQACYCLLFDSRSRSGRDPACRSWLSQVLSPVALLYHLPVAQQRALQPAWQLLPVNHAASAQTTALQNTPPPNAVLSQTLSPASTSARPAGLHKLRLAYCRDNPDFPLISQSMAAVLAAHQVNLECQPVSFSASHQGDAQSDCWLYELPLSAPPDFSVFASVLQTPLAQQCLAADWQCDARRWQSGDLNVSDWCQQRQRQRDLLPLFHCQPAASGWGDFQSLLPPLSAH